MRGDPIHGKLSSETPSLDADDARARSFFLSVLANLGVVIGERSVEALVRFAAVEAASEAAKRESAPLATLLAEYGRALGWEITLRQSTPKEAVAHVRWDGGPPGPAAKAVAQGLVHGLFLGATRSRAAESVVEDDPDGTSRVRVTRTM